MPSAGYWGAEGFEQGRTAPSGNDCFTNTRFPAWAGARQWESASSFHCRIYWLFLFSKHVVSRHESHDSCMHYIDAMTS